MGILVSRTLFNKWFNNW